MPAPVVTVPTENVILDAKTVAALQALKDRQAVVQAASTASDVAGVVVDLNALLTKLKNAGLMALS